MPKDLTREQMMTGHPEQTAVLEQDQQLSSPNFLFGSILLNNFTAKLGTKVLNTNCISS